MPLGIRGFWAFSEWMRSGPKVWIRGLLRKGLGLCHGIPGNGFALLKLHPTGGGILKKNCFQNLQWYFWLVPGEVWLNRALHFAVFAVECGT